MERHEKRPLLFFVVGEAPAEGKKIDSFTKKQPIQERKSIPVSLVSCSAIKFLLVLVSSRAFLRGNPLLPHILERLFKRNSPLLSTWP